MGLGRVAHRRDWADVLGAGIPDAASAVIAHNTQENCDEWGYNIKAVTDEFLRILLGIPPSTDSAP